MSCIKWIQGVTGDIDDMYQKGTFMAPGKQFMFFMGAMYLGVRGFMFYGQYYASNALVQKAQIGSESGALITSTMLLPWSLKCLWAMISDCQPALYYKKRWYMLIATVAGTWALFLLGTLSYDRLAGPEKKGTLILVLLLVVNTMGSVDDCLTQGQYTKVIKEKGPSILVFRSTCMTFAGFVVALYAGALNDYGSSGPQYMMLVSLPWAALACFPIAFNMMADERQETPCKTDTELFRRQGKIFGLAIFMGVTVLVNVAFGTVEVLTPWKKTRLLVTNGLMGAILLSSYVLIDRRIAHINVYLYACRLCTLGMGYPLQQFYTMDPNTCENKDMNLPGFTFVIYSTLGGLTSSLAVFLGLYLFENYLIYWNAQKAFWVTTAFQVFAGLFDIMNTTRFNQTLLGWTGLGNVQVEVRKVLFDASAGYRTVRADDMASFMFGSMFLEPLIDQLDGLPSTLLLSKLCPKGIETTMFAILAGFSNVGLSLSGQMGALAVKYFGYNFRVGDPSTCNMGGDNPDDPTSFHGLAKTLIVGNVILPFLTIPMTWIFIPNQTLDSDFLDELPEPREVEMMEHDQQQQPRTSSASVDAIMLRTAMSNVSGSRII